MSVCCFFLLSFLVAISPKIQKKKEFCLIIIIHWRSPNPNLPNASEIEHCLHFFSQLSQNTFVNLLYVLFLYRAILFELENVIVICVHCRRHRRHRSSCAMPFDIASIELLCCDFSVALKPIPYIVFPHSFSFFLNSRNCCLLNIGN